MLQGITKVTIDYMGYKGLQGFTEDYKGLQRVTRSFNRFQALQHVTWGTRVYRGY